MTKKSKIAILAGGFGTRLKNLRFDLPKPMFPINGKPLLLHQVLECKRYGFLDITMFLYHQHNIIRDYFKDGSKYGLNINYVVEDEPRGTAGAIIDGIDYLDDDFILICGDTYFQINLSKFYKFHLEKKPNISIFTHPNNHPYDSDIILKDKQDNIVEIVPYPHKNEVLPNLVSSGLYAINRDSLIQYKNDNQNTDLSKNLIPFFLNQPQKSLSYRSVEYIKDMGTPKRLDMVKNDILNKKPEILSDSVKRKAIFIDRDGTLIEEKGYITKREQIKLYPFSSEAIRKINDSGYLCIVITNQPVIARGDITVDELNDLHNFIDTSLGESGAYLDDIFYCPHHPDKGFDGEIPELKIICQCRKPGTKLIDDAIKKYNISTEDSWMIGDHTRDILAGSNVGLSTILVKTGHAGKDKKYVIEPTNITDNLSSAVNIIMDINSSNNHRDY